MLINLSNVYKDYQQDKLVVPVLKDVSLHVEEGEYVAVMGPSGSGKTTLMNIIGCLDLPTSGAYELDGEDILKCRDKELANVRLKTVGFVFQNFHLLQKESALENVALPLVYAGIRKGERLRMAQAALERVGLSDRVSFKPTQLSGGQKQRVAIARAMVNDPKILLADEPTGALDSQSGKQIMELFEKLNREGVTVIMITHDENIASHAKRIVRIIDGMVYEGEPRPGEPMSGEPNSEEPKKPGDSKQEDSKQEDSKQEDSKPGDPKQDDQEPGDPKPGDAKQENPKQEEKGGLQESEVAVDEK